MSNITNTLTCGVHKRVELGQGHLPDGKIQLRSTVLDGSGAVSLTHILHDLTAWKD